MTEKPDIRYVEDMARADYEKRTRIDSARAIREGGKVIEKVRQDLLCDVDNLPTVAQAHFLMALASLDTARAQLTLAFLHASKGE